MLGLQCTNLGRVIFVSAPMWRWFQSITRSNRTFENYLLLGEAFTLENEDAWYFISQARGKCHHPYTGGWVSQYSMLQGALCHFMANWLLLPCEDNPFNVHTTTTQFESSHSFLRHLLSPPTTNNLTKFATFLSNTLLHQSSSLVWNIFFSL